MHSPTAANVAGPLADRVAALARSSIDVIRAGQAPTGAYVAAPNFPVYRYCWFRDGAFVADAMSRAGHVDSAESFFDWCAEVLVARRHRVDALVAAHLDGGRVEIADLLHCRYTLDGEEATDAWWNFQLDGYGTWLWALREHSRRHELPLERFSSAIDTSVRYLTAFWSTPSYDWWEENVDHRHTSTLAALYAGLRAVEDLDFLNGGVRSAASEAAAAIAAAIAARGVRDGHLVKWLDGDALDASLIACATPFRVFDPRHPVMVETARRLETELAHGGVHRYAADTYYGGGEWILLAALLGWYYLEAGQRTDALAQLEWVVDAANDSGHLPEQLDGHLLAPDARAEWVARWGPVATPLLWSHAMFLTLALEFGLVEPPVRAAA